ncbi:AraC family transcriptional regulator [Paenibacillus sp. TRM 82003]|nr:AraC family transcriptional regulator [Paenibacillus sp. TRM 82003]
MSRKASYAVVSNPDPSGGPLQVLFTGRSQTKPGHRLGPKVFDHYLLHWVESGRGTFVAGEREYALGAGDSFVIYPEALVSYAADPEEPWAYRWIAFHGEEAAALVETAGMRPEAPTAHTGAEQPIGRWFERVMKAFRDKPPSVNLRANGCLQLLLAEYADAAGADADATAVDPGGAEGAGPGATLARQAIHYMTAQYAEPITIELMAESLGYNRAYLSRVFREHTGVNPVTFLARLRLDRARRLLRERLELTVEQVASSVGFADALYFSKQFRRAYGQSPSAYRTSLKRY